MTGCDRQEDLDDSGRPTGLTGQVYIAYTERDRDGAVACYDALATLGIPTFFDELLKPGDVWPTVLRDEINGAHLFIVLCSAPSHSWSFMEDAVRAVGPAERGGGS